MRTTEQDSLHSNLEQKSISALVGINKEDQKVALAVKRTARDLILLKYYCLE